MDEKTLIPLVLECGQKALACQNRLVTEFKSDNTLVTQADRDVEAMIKTRLVELFPQVPVLGEETSADQHKDFFDRTMEDACFVVDPIDGTAPYANGLPTWGVSLGWMLGGKLKKGLIYLPALGELYMTWGEKSYFSRISDPLMNPAAGALTALPGAPSVLPPGKMLALSQRLVRKGGFRLTNPFQATGSSVFALARIALGSYGGYAARQSLWDFAAGGAILKNLGYGIYGSPSGIPAESMSEVLEGSQSVSPWSSKETLVFAPPELQDILSKALEE